MRYLYEATDFELWIVKYIVLPLMCIALLKGCFDITNKNNICKVDCKKSGFAGFSYIPPHSYGYGGDKCYCLTEEDMKVKNKIPRGVEIW
ncbi:hypothetical protein [Thiofilum flexile]|uniref:hypothetical protein n=1 Tax=Thiofilum flexile TaxID=125627 RepID=UPI0003671B22|nr:hypothetical protein [Thiofilum flexile]